MANDFGKKSVKATPGEVIMVTKTSREEKRHMETRMVRDMLRRLGEDALKLAEELGPAGTPLNQKERQLIRIVKYRYLQELFREASVFYFTENRGDFISSLDHVRQAFTEDVID